jgi:CRISPR-associated endonuclease Csn1
MDKITEEAMTRRQLTDTAYLSRATKQFVEPLGARVQVSKGQTTALIRRAWGLNAILGKDDRTKNREDHRHHAVDAICIALTSPGLIKRIADIAKRGETSAIQQADDLIDYVRREVPQPWPSFAEEAKVLVEQIVTSHDVVHRARGQLHEETHVSPVEGGLVKKIPVDSKLSVKRILKIVDSRIREIITNHLTTNEGEPKKAFSSGNPVHEGRSQNRIRSVRVRENKRPTCINRAHSPHVRRHAETGNNLAVSIRMEDDWSVEAISLLEGVRQIHAQEDLEQTWIIFKSDLLESNVGFDKEADIYQNRKLWKVSSISNEPTRVRLAIVGINDASAKESWISIKTLKDFNFSSVRVDTLGRVLPPYDQKNDHRPVGGPAER